ncbi:metallophosphoesterase [Microscilla marina ATCC 23134]|uniref:Metallophosphoesterase n=2 Tax=Microscilla marina TaxID=1027 RepID=A1ZRQ4_MICM2|nr:metallophosphoesterase [Microscilla marina ATCC 23134]
MPRFVRKSFYSTQNSKVELGLPPTGFLFVIVPQNNSCGHFPDKGLCSSFNISSVIQKLLLLLASKTDKRHNMISLKQFIRTNHSLKLALLLWACIAGCSSPRKPAKTEFIILQLNDVYEIAPIQGGKFGGMARVATVRQELLKENPHTFTTLSGDFLNPSVLGTIKYNGARIKGAQMVATMNTLGIDYVCFGNHEFDLNEEDLLKRINESKFDWISTNLQYKKEGKIQPFFKVVNNQPQNFAKSVVLKIPNKNGEDTLKVGLLGLALKIDNNIVAYEDVKTAAEKELTALKGKIDFAISMTHLAIADDKKLAQAIPQFPLIMGGHDHTNMKHQVGTTSITKADANAKTVYIHRITYDHVTKKVSVRSELKEINESIKEAPKTAKVVSTWLQHAETGFNTLGFDVKEKLMVVTDIPLDGREDHIREEPTNLGKDICAAMVATLPKAQAGILNSGSVRLDDQLRGQVTVYDVLRALPYGGDIYEVQLKGKLLSKILTTGKNNKGSGGYLQTTGINYDETTKQWTIGKAAIEPEKIYTVAMSNYLLTGKESNFDYLTPKNPDIVSATEDNKNPLRADIRKALIEYWKKKGKDNLQEGKKK